MYGKAACCNSKSSLHPAVNPQRLMVCLTAQAANLPMLGGTTDIQLTRAHCDIGLSYNAFSDL